MVKDWNSARLFGRKSIKGVKVAQRYAPAYTGNVVAPAGAKAAFGITPLMLKHAQKKKSVQREAKQFFRSMDQTGQEYDDWVKYAQKASGKDKIDVYAEVDRIGQVGNGNYQLREAAQTMMPRKARAPMTEERKKAMAARLKPFIDARLEPYKNAEKRELAARAALMKQLKNPLQGPRQPPARIATIMKQAQRERAENDPLIAAFLRKEKRLAAAKRKKKQ